MRIEKLSDNQIKCILTKEDLVSRNIRLTELTYGSEKTKSLFRDMMQQAFLEYGFEAENFPLMIEAIPTADSIILIITKVEDPEELDSRFSRFSSEDKAGGKASPSEALSGLDDIIDLISKLSQARRSVGSTADNSGDSAVQSLTLDNSGAEDTSAVSARSSASDASAENTEAQEAEAARITRFYLFRDLDAIIRSAQAIGSEYAGHNSLFRNPEDNNYYLILRKDSASADLFNRICNVLTEYGLCVDYLDGMEAFFMEHMEPIRVGDALQALQELP